jgi:hypothetical protein
VVLSLLVVAMWHGTSKQELIWPQCVLCNHVCHMYPGNHMLSYAAPVHVLLLQAIRWCLSGAVRSGACCTAAWSRGTAHLQQTARQASASACHAHRPCSALSRLCISQSDMGCDEQRGNLCALGGNLLLRCDCNQLVEVGW